MVRPQFLANDEAQVVHHGRIPLLNGFLSPIGASVNFAGEQTAYGPREVLIWETSDVGRPEPRRIRIC